ncbi:YwqG family protein [Nonomuraea wenchangensis]|uniref:Uncharacterized protein YwqG n=1 Tax=Nonomuraea wenchangensis TaxID=568860 RepID=A0A1I0FMF5_9ACTN|nr:YwqG family protein [Nonomuraea wenchangensis]SET59561.1 Uncharacterized protein YwqG [Nonomuraea wenchangensis]
MTTFADLARAHLPADTADRLLALLRPAIQLSIAQDDQPVVGRLGGAADLPEGVPWPVGPSSRPLSLVATLDCARLARHEVDIELPGDGALLFFVEFEGDGDAVIHVPAGTPTLRQSEGWAHPEELLTARTVLTWPDNVQPELAEAFGGDLAAFEAVWRHVSAGREFMEVIGEYERRHHGSRHQVGGHAMVLQVPFEAVAAQRQGAGWYGEESFHAEARQWALLLQLDETDHMIWGDGAHLIWGIRRDHLAARDFSKTVFDVQGH